MLIFNNIQDLFSALALMCVSACLRVCAHIRQHDNNNLLELLLRATNKIRR